MDALAGRDREGFAETVAGGLVRCKACRRGCVLREREVGFCRVRRNEGGKLIPLSYGRVAAVHVANVERKPLYHFYPGKTMLSIGGLGCNFRCPGCQNRELAHAPGPEVLESVPYVSPEALVEQALGRRLLGISFTYNEPAIWFEYTLDTFKLAKHRGLMTNYVTNGSLTLEALNEIGPYLDAYRVDIKGFCETTYERVANFPKLEGILDGAARAKTDWGMHIECVTNVVPTLTDNFQELRGIAHWIASCLGRDTPWHVTRFVPYGDLAHLPQTPVSVLERARGIGLEEGLRFVYLGNVPGHPAENTYCPECGNILIRRSGIGLPETALVNGACPMCRYEVSGRWNE